MDENVPCSDGDALRMTLIALVSIIGSLVAMIGIALAGVFGMDRPVTYVLLVNGLLLDVLMDCCCIALSLKFSRKQYDQICGGCDRTLQRCCVKMTDKTTRKKEMELADVVRRETIDIPTASSSTQTDSVNMSRSSSLRANASSSCVTNTRTTGVAAGNVSNQTTVNPQMLP